ncbi:MAG: hypothetical protein ACI4N3_05210 [Alphaproteobacteria bacterium]
MQHSKISITILSLLLFGNSLNCMSATQKRILKRGKSGGTLVTPDSTIITNNPGQVPIVPPIEYEDKDGDGNNDILQPDKPNDNTSVSIPDTIADAEKIAKQNRIKEIRAEYRTYLNNAQLNCIGISKTLELIQGLAIGTTVVSGVGSLAAGGAMASELIQAGGDKTSLETGLLIGSATTSAGGVVTSAISLANVDDLISKMKSCKSDITNITNIKQRLLDEDVDETDTTILQVNDISSSCGGIDNSSVKNIESIKGLLIGSTITSGIGTVGSITATVTNSIATSDSTENNKKKKLNIATKISTGVAGGAQATSAILSGVTINKVNKDKDTADKCEDTLMKY